MESSSFDLGNSTSSQYSEISIGGSGALLRAASGLRKSGMGKKGFKMLKSSGAAGAIFDYLYCTPVKIYLFIAILSTLIYIGMQTMKGNFPGISMICCACCCISIGASVVGALCQVYFGVPAWASVILLLICACVGIFSSL